ncbi:hypothetical protein RU99_GL003129 [Enterococcus casseliflavus]|nr:hypothetical protein RU99_GL003129 [Enterococcus casseliflavus]
MKRSKPSLFIMFVILIGDFFCHLKSMAGQTVTGLWFSNQL